MYHPWYKLFEHCIKDFFLVHLDTLLQKKKEEKKKKKEIKKSKKQNKEFFHEVWHGQFSSIIICISFV